MKLHAYLEEVHVSREDWERPIEGGLIGTVPNLLRPNSSSALLCFSVLLVPTVTLTETPSKALTINSPLVKARGTPSACRRVIVSAAELADIGPLFTDGKTDFGRCVLVHVSKMGRRTSFGAYCVPRARTAMILPIPDLLCGSSLNVRSKVSRMATQSTLLCS